MKVSDDKAKAEAVGGPFYSCHDTGCAEEISYPPDMLRWYEALNETYRGWYCENCVDYAADDDLPEDLREDYRDRIGESLEEFLASQLLELHKDIENLTKG